MVGGHRSVMKLLADNGADISSGDVGQFACSAAEQNNIELLKEIVRHGGDVTRPKGNGTTALHVAVSEDNLEMVKFLLEQGAEMDKPDVHGWTPRDLADQQGHEEIKALFSSTKEAKPPQPAVANTIPQKREGIRYLGRFTSEPAIRPVPQEGSFSEGSWGQSRPRRRTSNFHNSLFGIMSAAQCQEKDLPFSVEETKACKNGHPARVTISCPEKGELDGKLVLLPGTFQELLDLGFTKFGLSPARVLNKDRAEIDDIRVIRDGDRLIFASRAPSQEAPSCNGEGTL